MDWNELASLGFNKNEAKVYLSLIKLGVSDVGRIISETKFHKNIVYDNLNKLLDKGLVTYVVENGRKVFKISSSDNLVEFFEEREREITEKKKKAVQISKEINKIAKKLKVKQEATIYRGKKGLKSFFNRALSGGDFFVFGVPRESLEMFGATFWKNYEIKRQDNKVRAKMIFNPSLKGYGETLVSKYTKIKYFDGNFEPLTQTFIQGEEVAIMVWTEEPFLFLIQDKNAAKSYMKYFEDMWKEAKK